MQQLTKKQHFVPRFYLKRWCDPAGKIWLHDLKAGRNSSRSPKSAFTQEYYYEADPKAPDNVFEDYLGDLENRSAPALDRIVRKALSVNGSLRKRGNQSLQLDNDDMRQAIDFLAHQYFRVPGAVDQKAFETAILRKNHPEIEEQLKPGAMTLGGYRHAAARFHSMKITLLVSQGEEFLTSDRPCFDMKDSDQAPSLGEDIGRDPGVVLYCPLDPKVGMVMFPETFRPDAHKVPKVWVKVASNSEVRNSNNLIIQQAEQYVVGSVEKDFIAVVSKKSKRGYAASRVKI